MRIQRWITAVLTVILLALAGCDGAPMAPVVGTADAMPLFSKEKFVTCKPHVAPGEDPADAPLLVVVAPDQAVEVNLGEYRHSGRFHGEFQVEKNGRACGQARLKFEADYAEGGSGIVIIIIVVSLATVAEVEGRTVVAFAGTAEACSEREGECHTDRAQTAEFTGAVELPARGTFHPGGVNVSMGDGSVRFIKDGSLELRPGSREGADSEPPLDWRFAAQVVRPAAAFASVPARIHRSGGLNGSTVLQLHDTGPELAPRSEACRFPSLKEPSCPGYP